MEINLSIWVPIVQGIVTVIALGVGSYVGVAGLQTWKHQLKFKEEYDLARRLLLSVYKLRDAMSFARITGWHMKALDSLGREKVHEFEEPRIQAVDQARSELKLGMQEAELMWGFTVRFELEQLWILASAIQEAYQIYDWFGAENPSTSDDSVQPLFRPDLGKEDEFAKQVQGAMSKIEEIMRPKLTIRRAYSRKPIMKWL